MDACLAAMIAFGLDDMRATRVRDHQHTSRRQPRIQERGAIIVTGVALVVLVATQLPQWPYVKPLAPVLPTSIRRVIPAGDPVAITYPYADGSLVTQPLLWQADDGYRFRLTGGYSFHPDPSGGGWDYTDPMSPFGLQRFLFIQQNSCSPENPFRVPGGCGTIPLTPDLVATARTTLSKYDVRLVIVDRSTVGSGPVMKLFSEALGPPKLSSGHFSLWSTGTEKPHA